MNGISRGVVSPGAWNQSVEQWIKGNAMVSVTRFERWILLPLDAVFSVLALVYLVRAEWFGGIVALTVLLVMVSIGRSLNRNKTDALSARGDNPGLRERYVPGHLTESESLLVTKALAYSTPALTIAVVVLAIYSGVNNIWVITIGGLGTAVVYLLLAKVVVQLVPLVIARKRRNIYRAEN